MQLLAGRYSRTAVATTERFLSWESCLCQAIWPGWLNQLRATQGFSCSFPFLGPCKIHPPPPEILHHMTMFNLTKHVHSTAVSPELKPQKMLPAAGGASSRRLAADGSLLGHSPEAAANPLSPGGSRCGASPSCGFVWVPSHLKTQGPNRFEKVWEQDGAS